MHLNPDVYEVKAVDLSDFRHSDAFQTDCIVMPQPWTNSYLHIIERCKLNYKIPVVIDVDDLVNELPSDHPDYASFVGNCLNQIIQAADHVVFSTEYLRQKFAHMNRHISVIPNSVSAKHYSNYQPLPKPYKNTFIVGWTGGQSHRSDQLYTFIPGLQKFLRKYPDAKAYFHVLCPDILLKEFGSQIIYEPQPCEFLDYYAMAASYPFDVCLVGLLDTPFNHAKSDLKLLEMAPNRIPLIASPRADFIQHLSRDIMFYAEDNSEKFDGWFETLEYAYNHRDEIKAKANRAYDYVMKNRLSDKACKLWQNVLDAVFGVKDT